MIRPMKNILNVSKPEDYLSYVGQNVQESYRHDTYTVSRKHLIL